MNENQRGALTSFVYNCGTGKRKRYLIFANIRKFQEGKMTQQNLVTYWQKSVITGDGKVLKGLIRRRAAEAHLFFTEL
ncbi:MAG: hypothetical protein IPG85_11950 [Bacteroidetes bacterium]|nr:hypothetical protein [Bacteroidota bacterium]